MKSKARDALKLFAISNQMMEADFDALEHRLGLSLGRAHERMIDKDDTYYPQFDEKIRREASGMADHYEIFCNCSGPSVTSS